MKKVVRTVKKEVSDKLWEDLKAIVVVALEECEKSAGMKVGRDETERRQYIDKTAGMVYGHLTEEVRVTVHQFITETSKRAEKFS